MCHCIIASGDELQFSTHTKRFFPLESGKTSLFSTSYIWMNARWAMTPLCFCFFPFFPKGASHIPGPGLSEPVSARRCCYATQFGHWWPRKLFPPPQKKNHFCQMKTNVCKHHTTCIFQTKFICKVEKIQHLLRNNTTKVLLCDVDTDITFFGLPSSELLAIEYVITFLLIYS